MFPALGLAQIYPMTDELTGLEPKVVSASFADPYALLVRDDASILLLQCVENGDLEEVERTDSLLASKWLSGCLYDDRDSVFTPAVIRAGSKTKARSTAMFLLSAQGGLHVSSGSDSNVLWTMLMESLRDSSTSSLGW